MGSIDIQPIGITSLKADALVNATNNSLKPAGTVSKAIFEAAGWEQLQAACEKIGHCETGSAVITPGYQSNAKYIIHAVGPVWRGGEHREAYQLYDAYWDALELAYKNDCRSIGFPLIATGARKYSKEGSLRLGIRACLDFFSDYPDYDVRVVFAVRNDTNVDLGKRLLKESASKTDMTKRRENYEQFVASTICTISGRPFEKLRSVLIGYYLHFSIIEPRDITPNILAEKASSYFKMLEEKTGKSFVEHQRDYIQALDEIVAPRVAERPVGKDIPTDGSVPRARRYYEKARRIKESENVTTRQLIDYSRIMLCLYAEIIKKNFATIENFDYSTKSLNPRKIIRAMRDEEVPSSILPFAPMKRKLDTSDPCGHDACMLVIAIIMLYTIENESIEGGERV